MSTMAFVLILVVDFGSIALAQLMAVSRARSARVWMWSAALLGPLPIAALALLPRRR